VLALAVVDPSTRAFLASTVATLRSVAPDAARVRTGPDAEISCSAFRAAHSLDGVSEVGRLASVADGSAVFIDADELQRVAAIGPNAAARVVAALAGNDARERARSRAVPKAAAAPGGDGIALPPALARLARRAAGSRGAMGEAADPVAADAAAVAADAAAAAVPELVNVSDSARPSGSGDADACVVSAKQFVDVITLFCASVAPPLLSHSA
jgi:hypothetical protein